MQIILKFIGSSIKLSVMYLKLVSNWYHSIKTFLTLFLKFKTFLKRIQFKSSLHRAIKLLKLLWQSLNELLQHVEFKVLYENKRVFCIHLSPLYSPFMSHVTPLSLFAAIFYSCFAEGELLIKKVPEILKLLDRVWKLSDEKS